MNKEMKIRLMFGIPIIVVIGLLFLLRLDVVYIGILAAFLGGPLVAIMQKQINKLQDHELTATTLKQRQMHN